MLSLQLTPSAAAAPALAAALLLVYVVYAFVSRLYLSPLRHIPGPKLWAASQIFYSATVLSGRGHKIMVELHRKYGPIVRVAPTQVSCNDANLWKEVWGHRKGAGQLEHNKDPLVYKLQGSGLIGAISTEEHARQRRILSHAFSAQSMVDQQPLILRYIDLLITRLKEVSQQDGQLVPVDVVKWYALTTFDVISDLSFGEPFGGLHDSEYHPWIALILPAIKVGNYILEGLRFFPNLDKLLLHTPIGRKMVKTRRMRDAYTFAQVQKRMQAADRPDFMHHILGKTSDGQDKLTLDEIRLHANLLIVAGSETTATALSGVTYLLGTHPEVLAKLTKEVRESFSSESEINLLSVQHLKYMLAILDETMRVFPAVPGSFPRVVHKGGDVICGTFIPEDTTINNWQWVMFHNAENFALPDSFIPERWLGDERFVNDKKEAFKPFSHGPRDCIGKNLAYAEMRTILARLIWNFDFELVDKHTDWIDKNRVYGLWDKDPLRILLHPRS